MKLKAFRDNEEGSTAIIAAVAFTVIMVFCGLVIDMGSSYFQSSRVQTAADAAAYAAATLLPVAANDAAGVQQVQTMAAAYALKNGMAAGNVQAVYLEDAVSGYYTSVRVLLNKDVSYFFGPIVGISGTLVNKSAKVQAESVSALSNMVPLGIEVSRFADTIAANQCQHIVIKYGGGGGTTGFFGALDLDGVKGGGAKDFSCWLAFGYGGILKVGAILPFESGDMNGPTNMAFMTRYCQCTHYSSQGGCNAEHFDPSCPRVINLIVYTLSANRTIRVEGFAPFVLEGINDAGEVIASHVDIHASEGETTAFTADSINFGISRNRLVG